jgi:hypothetical protein
MTKKLNKEQLLQLLADIAPSTSGGVSAAEFETLMSAFCAGCPDPVRAKWLLLDCLDPLTDEELVERALAMPAPKKPDVPVRAYSHMPLAMPAFVCA